MAALFQLPATDDELKAIAERNSFKAMSGGRERGQESGASFQPKPALVIYLKKDSDLHPSFAPDTFAP